jgi:predicted enzyme related to lactoylglutathione lyase
MDKVQHFEIPTDDIERSKTFYSEVFGWNTVKDPTMNYVMVHTAKTDEKGMIQEMGAINGGIIKRDKTFRGPVITISVGDIDKTLASIKEHGGKMVMGKMQIGDMGFSAYFKDSEGNLMGLFQDTKSAQ